MPLCTMGFVPDDEEPDYGSVAAEEVDDDDEHEPGPDDFDASPSPQPPVQHTARRSGSMPNPGSKPSRDGDDTSSNGRLSNGTRSVSASADGAPTELPIPRSKMACCNTCDAALTTERITQCRKWKIALQCEPCGSGTDYLSGSQCPGIDLIPCSFMKSIHCALERIC